jgi:hypothetical protein
MCPRGPFSEQGTANIHLSHKRGVGWLGDDRNITVKTFCLANSISEADFPNLQMNSDIHMLFKLRYCTE